MRTESPALALEAFRRFLPPPLLRAMQYRVRHGPARPVGNTNNAFLAAYRINRFETTLRGAGIDTTALSPLAASSSNCIVRTVAKQIEQPDLFPEPWNLLAVGCPMRRERHLNDHGHDCSRHIEVLSVPVPFGEDRDFWPRMGTWLRSTREARLLAREEQWRRKEKKQRIAPAERTKIAQNIAPTSIFDCFWRMRIRSNYGTIDPYLVNHISETDHVVYSRALCTVSRATLALLELFIMRKVGKHEFANIASDFIAKDRHNLSARMLHARVGAYGLS